jgi:hypothetical protein
MRKRIWFVALMAGLLLMLVYRTYFNHQPVSMEGWYEGQDITEGSDPMPFDASRYTPASYPERDEQGNLPSDIYRIYIDAAARGDFEQRVLTEASHALFATRQPSREQLRNSVISYRECGGGEELALHNLAAMRFPPDQRLCPPVLFRREQGLWRLSFADMHDHIGLNQRNQWHFLKGEPPLEYVFAFAGWRFDDGGYPLIP